MSDSARQLWRDIKDLDDESLLKELYQDLGDQYNDGNNGRVYRYSSRRQFNAVTSELTYVKFLVPVWLSKYGNNPVEGTYEFCVPNGYVLYPDENELLPVKRVLREVTLASSHAMDIVALSIMPVALALESLHQPTKHRSQPIYHRDLNIENVYLPFVKAQGGSNYYGEAKVKLGVYSGVSFPDGVDFEKKYYHHPDLADDNKLFSTFHEKYDWYSFGIYILDVLYRVVHGEGPDWRILDRTSGPICDRIDKFLTKHLDVNQVEDGIVRKRLISYVDVLRRCSRIADYDDTLVYGFEGSHGPQFNCMVRGVRRATTAELMELYQQHRSAQYQLEKHVPGLEDGTVAQNEEPKCQACLLEPAEKLQLYTYSSDDHEHDLLSFHYEKVVDTKESLKTFCGSCYMNGSMLFNYRKRCVATSIPESIYLSFEQGKVSGIFQQLDRAWSMKNDHHVEVSKMDIVKEEDLCSFTRMAAPYFRNEFSSFIMPVWGAAFSEFGLILYPDSTVLEPANEVLQRVGNADPTLSISDKNQQILQCALSVAFALDGLHERTERRSAYFHGAVCIENVYFLRSNARLRAKLKISKKTRSVLEHQMYNREEDVQYWHPELPNDYRKCDMYSFGLFICECVLCAYPLLGNLELRRDIACRLLRMRTVTNDEGLANLISVAKECIEGNGISLVQPTSHEDCMQRFEHGIKQTTLSLYKLLAAQDNSNNVIFTGLCQACHLRLPVDIPLGMLTNNDEDWCDNTCTKIYCRSCYTNGERLFCPTHMSLRLPFLGPHCYALICYGLHSPPRIHMFKTEAYQFRNCLMHNRIRSIPEENIVMHEIRDQESFKKECEEMKKKIHVKERANSVYSLIIVYTGHGKPPPDVKIVYTNLRKDQSVVNISDGSWFPVPGKDPIPYEAIDSATANIHGERHCSSVLWLMDHCVSNQRSPQVIDRQFSPLSLAVRGPSSSSSLTSSYVLEYGCPIIQFFCRLMKGVCECNRPSLSQCDWSKPLDGKHFISAKCTVDYKRCLKQHRKLKEKDLQAINIEVKPDPGTDAELLPLSYHDAQLAEYIAYTTDGGKPKEMPLDTEDFSCSKVRGQIGECLLTHGHSETSLYSIVCDWNIHHLLCKDLTGSFEFGTSQSVLVWENKTVSITVELALGHVNPDNHNPDKLTSFNITLPSKLHQEIDRNRQAQRNDVTGQRSETSQGTPPDETRIPMYPSLMEFIVHEIRHKAEGTLSPENLEIFTSLLTTLLGSNLPSIYEISNGLWQTLMHMAGDKEAVNRRFTIILPATIQDQQYKIKWRRGERELVRSNPVDELLIRESTEVEEPDDLEEQGDPEHQGNPEDQDAQ